MDAEALQQACQSLQKVLDEAHLLMQDSGGLRKISDAPGSLFCPAIPIYSQLLRSITLTFVIMH